MRTLILISAMILFVGCKKDKLEEGSEIFIGKWNWSHTRYIHELCSGGPSIEDTLTSETENVNYSMEFYAKGIVKFYEDDNQIERARLVLAQFDEDVSGYSFGFYLNNKLHDEDYLLQGWVDMDQLVFIRGFPYRSLSYPLINVGCEKYISYFVKE